MNQLGCPNLNFFLCPFVSAGGGEEQAAAANVFTMLCIQLGGGDEAEEGFKSLCPVLTSILNDSSANIAARQSVSDALFLANRTLKLKHSF